jgi:hypothetical protein
LALYVAQPLAELRGRRGPRLRVPRHRLLDHRAHVGRQTRFPQAGHRMLGDPQELGHHLLALWRSNAACPVPAQNSVDARL